MKVALIQLWFGSLPEYFNYHLETTKNIDLIDFYFFTDQDLDIQQDNFFYHKIDREYVTDYLSKIFSYDIKFTFDYKYSDIKSALTDIFYIHIKDYDYVGYCDLDILFGDVNKFLRPLLDHYDFISIGEKTFHNRLSGPFTIYRNTEEFRTLYKVPEFIDGMNQPNVVFFEEIILDQIVNEKYSKQLITEMNVNSINGNLIYETTWNGGQLNCDNREIFIHHFYLKNNTLLGKIGNTIYTKYKKTILDDFMWVIHFSQTYEKYVPQLLKSIHNYSNRKCIIYTINYDSNLKYEYQYISDQFIFIRMDIPPGKLDTKGRDISILNSKPIILSDTIDRFPNKKFVYIDTDISLTVNSDKVFKYFNELENYPLINSHIHDVIFLNGLTEDGGLTSSLHTLLDLMGIEPNIPLPRRKCNIIIFDKNSKWFFSEQMKLYEKFKNYDDPVVLALHDEDTANTILTKYQLYKSLPLIDIEETYDLSLDILHKYSYSLTPISEHVVLPKNLNEILFFHGFKTEEDFELIKMNYGKKTLSHDNIYIYYKNDTLFIERNNFMVDKKFEKIVDLIVYNKEYQQIFHFPNQDIANIHLFFIDNFQLEPDIYLLEIIESESRRVIYHNNFQI